MNQPRTDFISMEDMKGKIDQCKTLTRLETLLEVCLVSWEKLINQEETQRNNEESALVVKPKKRKTCTSTTRKNKTSSSSSSRSMMSMSRRIRWTMDNAEGARIPEEFAEYIRGELKGRDMKLLIEKRLYSTDVARNEGRLSIPKKQMCKGVLTEDEERKAGARGDNNQVVGMEVTMVNPVLTLRNIVLKCWDMRKGNGKVSSMYLLGRNWNDVVKDYGLRENEVVQLWGFRMGHHRPGELGLALVRPGTHA